jgi:F-type H+-transporting ATPase subunit b
MVGFGLVALALAGCGKSEQAEAKHEAVRYEVVYHEANAEQEKTLAANDPHLAELLRDGHVESLNQEKPINILGIATDLGLWTIVVFLLLLYILRKRAWEPMLEGLQKREQKIQGAIDDAQRARDDAKALEAKWQGQMDQAQGKVRELIDSARKDAQKMTDEMVARARTEIQGERDRLRREIETARDQALQELWNQTARLATVISAKAIRRQLSADDHRRLVDEALGEIRQAGQQAN